MSSSKEASLSSKPHPASPANPPYSPAHLKQRLEYATQVLARRNISPRTEKYYSLFKEQISRALNAKTPEDKLKREGGVEAMERVITETAFLRPGSLSETMEMEAALLQLRELQYLTLKLEESILDQAMKVHGILRRNAPIPQLSPSRPHATK